ncbi:hypothetical protein KL949_000948 [Ogataea haglerorum]|nr:hypothetical protein KL913_000952 [Ogataea haglerorum]KAG7721970.1 hypothetical protein KL949_000948 [Ogataea haglerorum]KAG7770299.1 hypothetical protein KL931_002063 [Ogataea haglerorum]
MLIQNGMGVLEELYASVWPRPSERPVFYQGVITHGVFQDRDQEGTFSYNHAGNGDLKIARVDGKKPDHPVVQTLVESDLRTTVYSHEELLVHQVAKLMLNCCMNPTTAVLDCVNYEIDGVDPIREYFSRLVHEAMAILRARYPFLEGRAELAESRLVEFILEKGCKVNGNNSTSMRQDTLFLRDTEIDYINGYVVRLAEQLVLVEVALWPLVDLVSVHDVPHHTQEHRAPVDQHRPVHHVWGVICSFVLREVQDRNHERHKTHCHHSGRNGEHAQVPRALLERFSRVGDPEQRRHGKGDERANCSDRENGIDRRFAAKHEQQQQLAQEPVGPHSVDRSLCGGVDVRPDLRQRETAVSRVREEHSGRGNHTGKGHGEGEHNGERGQREHSLLSQDLRQIRDVRLAQLVVDGIVNVDDRVRHGELENEPENASHGRGQHDGPRRRQLGVAALLGQVERRVETGHRPDHGHEAHQDADSVRPLGEVGDSPGHVVAVELGQPLVASGVTAQDHNERDEQKEQVERGRAGVDPGDPSGRERGDDRAEKRQTRRQQIQLPVGGRVVWVVQRLERQNHAGTAVRNRWSARHLHKVVRPANKPGEHSFVAGRGKHGRGIVESARSREGARDLGHGARDGHDTDHAHQIRPGESCIAGVGERVPQGGRDRGQKTEHRERDSEGGEQRELSFELLLVAEGQNDGLVLVHGVVHNDSLRLVGENRSDVHLVHREDRGGGPDRINVWGHGAKCSPGSNCVYI